MVLIWEKRKVFEVFDSLNSKNQIHEYYGISDNSAGAEYIINIAKEIGFDLDTYKKRKIKYCKQCGCEIKTKFGKIFCSSSCAATYNNQRRERKKKDKPYRICSQGTEQNGQKPKKIIEYKCSNCDKIFTSTTENRKFCSTKCQSEYKHKLSYKDFLDNNEKYCNGGYTPKRYKKEFLEEQGGKCAICRSEPIHNGKPLTFILDHIDGDASNNKRENLRLICPNCDSQLDTYKSKNHKSARRSYWKDYLDKKIKTIYDSEGRPDSKGFKDARGIV